MAWVHRYPLSQCGAQLVSVLGVSVCGGVEELGRSFSTVFSGGTSRATATFCSMQYCDFFGCNFSFMNNSIYNIHVRTTHSHCKPPHKRVCKKCSTIVLFCHKRDLNRHLNSVHNHTVHSCDLCTAKYRRKDHLVRHCRKHHGSSLPCIPPSSPVHQISEDGAQTSDSDVQSNLSDCPLMDDTFPSVDVDVCQYLRNATDPFRSFTFN